VGKVKYLIIAVVALILVVVIGYFLYNYLNSKAAIFVESEPVSIVYVDGKQVGKTPYEGEFDEKEITLKLVPESFDQPLLPYETNVSLSKGVRTVVRRSLGESRQTSSGEIVSFEKIGGEAANVSVITTPDGAEVIFDSKDREFSPARFSSVPSGSHNLEAKAEGYLSRKFDVIAENGYNLTAIVELAKDLNYTPEESEEPKEATASAELKQDVKEITIMDTPTGFLRVRSGPSVIDEEVGRVTPGETYDVVSIDEDTGWYEIEFDKNESGWVTNNYATPSGKVKN